MIPPLYKAQVPWFQIHEEDPADIWQTWFCILQIYVFLIIIECSGEENKRKVEEKRESRSKFCIQLVNLLESARAICVTFWGDEALFWGKGNYILL